MKSSISPEVAGWRRVSSGRYENSFSHDHYHNHHNSSVQTPANHHHHHPNPNFPPTYWKDRPPRLRQANPESVSRPNFEVQLVYLLNPNHTVVNRRPDLKNVISQCSLSPEKVCVYPSGSVGASLFYRQWVEALSAMVALWDYILRTGTQDIAPKVISKLPVPSDAVELKEKLRELFLCHVRSSIMEGEIVNKWRKKIEEKSNEVLALTNTKKKKGLTLEAFSEFKEKKKGLIAELELMKNRVMEFETAMQCFLQYLEVEEKDGRSTDVVVFRLDGEYTWLRIHKLILRECKRMEDGLPIYSFRQSILNIIAGEQVMVLIGETGSGKSTQLVQFLADSGVAANKSIVCTQPRKISASSLMNRVREECNGCFKPGSVASYPTFSSTQQFDSKIIYMTDNNLLQHYMNDHDLSEISCIIIDEAHERSLNTDLLLAMVKDLLKRRIDLRLVIMSATANAKQLSDYFFGCGIVYVTGRNFPVEVKYVAGGSSEGTSCSGVFASYAHDVMRMAFDVHKTEKEGTILAFLTSQAEVEWACQRFDAPFAVALPLHGKLSLEEQFQVFQNYPGKRKVIFATNVAETSLTIPGVKYVIDSGMVKESKFEPGTGMNVLRVCRISQSSANQRAGRAGRTEPGICYRLYTESDFDSMTPNQDPEIRRVHLGVAVLRILALGIKNMDTFDFVDAPSTKSIEMAIRNLVQLGAITQKNGILELTEEGRYVIKLGIEPRLGKLILGCFHRNLGKEGLVLAAVMANSSSMFCRVGNDDEKLKADRLKVQFCHRNGDLFTLLSVYKEWECVPRETRNKWCWENSINAKSMRRCEDTVKEMEICLEKELNFLVPCYWTWNPHDCNINDRYLKEVILSSLTENVAMYSGYDQLGYKVALTGQHVKLHPSSSLLIFGEKPSWVVFSELLSINTEYLVCVNAFDFESLSILDPPPLFDLSEMESSKLHRKVLTGFGNNLLKRFCGKFNSSLLSLLSNVRTACKDERIGIEVNFNQNEISLFASSQDMEKVSSFVNDSVEDEERRLRNECMEKYLYHGPGIVSSTALFGAGAEIKHLELEKRCLTFDVYHYSNLNSLDDKELLAFLENYTQGNICVIHKTTNNNTHENDVQGRWGQVTFLTPDSAKKAAELDEVDFQGAILKLLPSRPIFGADHKMFSFPAVKAKVYWPRRPSRGFGILKCDVFSIGAMIDDLSNLIIRESSTRCEPSKRSEDAVLIYGLDKEVSEAEALDVFRTVARGRIHDFFVVRGDPVMNPPSGICEEALYREISAFMPKKNPHTNCCRVQVFPPEPKDTFVRAMITFDGRLHLEAAKALQQLQGKVLPGCLPWQKIACQQLFQSSLSCPASVYVVIKKQLENLVGHLNYMKGAECCLDRNHNGSYRVRISANATKTVAQLRKLLEDLISGKIINDESLTPTIMQYLFSRDGINIVRSLQRETQTYIFFDRQNHNVKVFGPPEKIELAQQKLVRSLLSYHETKQLEIHLRRKGLPSDLMKEVVKKFGPNLQLLKDELPDGSDLTLDVRNQIISVHGDIELKRKVEEMVYEVAKTNDDSALDEKDVNCRICLCEVEDGYKLEGCSHVFCRSCLIEQCESTIRNLDSFPIHCTHENCRVPLLLTDLRSLLSVEKLEELFRASLGSFVASSKGAYRFCPSPDCPSVYKVAGPGSAGDPFLCGACYAETCTMCHLESHPYFSCELYKEFKTDPDSSLKEWCRGKDHVKTCPVCGYTIEKVEGCNHVECKCGRHICWVCMEVFDSSELCYDHLRSVHHGIQ